MSELPSGTVTFLFTDIEGSTRLWEQHPEAMHTTLVRHDALLRGAIEADRGHVFKTIGDAFCAVFATAPDALSAALEAQRALHQEAWGEVGSLRVRMAAHTSAVEQRGGDYFGPALNRVARLLAAAHGGQVLLTQATADLVQDLLPAGASLRALGVHHLRDLAQPEALFQLLHPDLPADFPPLRSLRVAIGAKGSAADAAAPSPRARGIQALRERNIDQAINLLVYVVMADTRDAEATALLGVAYSEKGLHDQARRALQTAVELQPQNATYHFNLGVALERAGDVDRAAAEYERALQINPQYAQARKRLQGLKPGPPGSTT